jgi:stage V sporulation protein B
MRLKQKIDGLASKFPDRFISNAIWQYASSFGTLGFGFAYVLCLGRYLGKAEFGLFSLGLSSATLIFNIFELRLHEAVIRYVTEHWQVKDTKGTFSTIQASLILDLVTGIIAFGVLVLLAPWLQEYLLKDSRGVTIVTLAGFAVFFAKIGSVTATGVLRVFDRYKWASIVSLLGAALKLFTGCILIFMMHVDLISLLIASIFCSLAANLFLIYVSLRCILEQIPDAFKTIDFKLIFTKMQNMRRFILANYYISILEIGFKDLDINMLGWLSSLESVGSYKIAKTFVALVGQVTDPMVFVLLPEFSKLYTKGLFRECASLIVRLSSILLGVSILSFICAWWTVPVFINLSLGAEYQSTGVTFRYMLWFLPVVMPLMWAHSLTCAANKPNLYLIASFTGNTISIMLYLVLIPPLSGIGAAITYAVGMSITSIVASALAWRFCLKPYMQS